MIVTVPLTDAPSEYAGLLCNLSVTVSGPSTKVSSIGTIGSVADKLPAGIVKEFEIAT